MLFFNPCPLYENYTRGFSSLFIEKKNITEKFSFKKISKTFYLIGKPDHTCGISNKPIFRVLSLFLYFTHCIYHILTRPSISKCFSPKTRRLTFSNNIRVLIFKFLNCELLGQKAELNLLRPHNTRLLQSQRSWWSKQGLESRRYYQGVGYWRQRPANSSHAIIHSLVFLRWSSSVHSYVIGESVSDPVSSSWPGPSFTHSNWLSPGPEERGKEKLKEERGRDLELFVRSTCNNRVEEEIVSWEKR